MADVRLTATNPEDSSVVPVACDASGRLLLEEPQVVEGPPGPPGPKGDDGDPFSGNFADDVTFGGSATFAGGDITMSLDGQITASKVFIEVSDTATSFLDTLTSLRVYNTQDTIATGTSSLIEFRTSNTGNPGRGRFGCQRTGGNFGTSFVWAQRKSRSSTVVETAHLDDGGNLKLGGTLPASPNITLNADGSATFAGNKAGFTAEGYLWCTTRRGDTVILDATSNGLASWVEYTPTSRIDEIRDKLDVNRPQTGEMAADTP